MARINHASCSHPRTAAGRRACRAGVAPVAPIVAPTTKIVNGEIRDLCATCRKNVVRVGNVDCWHCTALAVPALPTIDTPAGKIRTGSIIVAEVRGGANTTYTVLDVSEDIKNGYAGWDAEGRWGYADQVVRVIRF